MPTFQEWLREKTEEAKNSERAQRLDDWVHAYNRLVHQIIDWLQEEGAEYVNFESRLVERAEQGLGTYKLNAQRIMVGDASVRILPIGRNVIGRIDTGTGTSQRAAGGVEITDEVGGRKYTLYRIVQDGQDVWYAVDERGSVTKFDKERFQEILMDLMS